jgi:hypothetical protein
MDRTPQRLLIPIAILCALLSVLIGLHAPVRAFFDAFPCCAVYRPERAQ